MLKGRKDSREEGKRSAYRSGLEFTYTGSLPWSGIPGTCWIWAQNMDMHEYATVLKVELEGEITYNLGHGEVVTNND